MSKRTQSNRVLRIVAAIGMLAIAASCGNDSEPHEAALAVTHVAAAIDRYEADGLDSTVAHYDDPASIDGEFYVVILDPDNLVLTHPFRPDLTGTIAESVVVDDGTPATEAIRDSVASGNPAWVSFTFVSPANNEVERKHVWAVPHDGHVFISGYYEPLS